MKPKKRIGILTSGGDAPGLNTVIRAAVVSALQRGWEVMGLARGFEGLLKPQHTRRLEYHGVDNILKQGGTILGTTNRGNPFDYPADGARINVSATALRNFKKLKLDALIVLGGDGSLKIAHRLFRLGIPLVGVPKTIDNDVLGTDATFGFDTAVSVATDALDKMRATAQSHERVICMEVMGRYAGWIALHAGVAGGADAILLPEIPFHLAPLCRKIKKKYEGTSRFALVVCAEGARQSGGEYIVSRVKTPGTEYAKLGGVAEFVAREIEKRTGCESRSLVLSYLQRGAEPSGFDRVLATRLGAAAVDLIERKKFGHMVALATPNIISIPIIKAVSKMKTVPPDADIVRTARALGILFGDEI